MNVLELRAYIPVAIFSSTIEKGNLQELRYANTSGFLMIGKISP